VQFARPLERFLARRSFTLIVVDPNGLIKWLIGRYSDRFPKYFKGPDKPRLGDITYSERVMSGFEPIGNIVPIYETRGAWFAGLSASGAGAVLMVAATMAIDIVSFITVPWTIRRSTYFTLFFGIALAKSLDGEVRAAYNVNVGSRGWMAEETGRDLNTLADIFANTARLYPTRAALWVDGCIVTYGELYTEAERLAAAISAVPSSSFDLIGRQCGLLVNRSRAAYISVLGALFAGCTYVPLNPRFPTDRLLSILRASHVDVVIVDEGSMVAAAALLPVFPRPLTILLPEASRYPDWSTDAGQHHFACRDDIERITRATAPERQTEDDGAYLLFTSGSTGTPKGILIRHCNVVAYLRSVLARYQPWPEDRFTQLFDFSFDLSVHDMFVCWSSGACLYCPPASAVVSPGSFVRKHALTFWFSVPSTVATMARLRMLGPTDLPSLRVSLFCGEALPAGLARIWRQAAPNSIIENLYGPTEATIAITAYRVPDDEILAGGWGVVPIGLPFPGQQAAVIDTEGNLVPDGEPGELCICGSQVATGYWRLPEITAERFAAPLGVSEAEGAWYRTGDRVVKDPKCGFVFLGRLDRQAKIRGHRVDLQEVETVIREVAGSESVAALCWPPDGASLARYIVAFVGGEERSPASIIAHCEKKLPSALVPRQIFPLPAWPLNGNGKTDYAALKQRLIDSHDK
jgi:amino acid adenylation domain-containing protein